MNNPGEISTPKNKCRHLGLRRTIERPKHLKTPLSDVKINYKSLQNNAESSPLPVTESAVIIEKDPPASSSPSTPCLLQNKVRSAYTINSLPSRLSLSSRMRDRYKKKKLQFSVATTNEKIDTLPPTCSKVASEADNSNDLLKEITDAERIISSHEKHKENVKELEALIDTWKDAFKASLEELSSKIEPKMDTEELLDRLGIDPEMIEYT